MIDIYQTGLVSSLLHDYLGTHPIKDLWQFQEVWLWTSSSLHSFTFDVNIYHTYVYLFFNFLFIYYLAWVCIHCSMYFLWY